MLDIIVLIIGCALFGMAVFFFFAMILAVVLYFFKNNVRQGVDLKKKFIALAKTCDSGRYSCLWRSSVPYAQELKPTLNRVLELAESKKSDGVDFKPILSLLSELNSRVRSNVRGHKISDSVTGHTVLDIQAGLDLIRKSEQIFEDGSMSPGYYLIRMPGGGERKVMEKEIIEQEAAIRRFGSQLHLFSYEVQKGFISIPFIYRNVRDEVLAVYPDQMDIFGSDVGLYGDGINSFAGIQFLTGYPTREMPLITSIIHASYASALETVLTQVSGYVQTSSGIDSTAAKILENAVASHPPQSRPEK